MDDADAPEVILVTQLPPDSWFEGFAVRPNGHILAACLAEPLVYDLDAEDPDAEPQLVYEFPGVACAMNLCPIPGRPDQYSVMTSSTSDLAACRWEGFAIWHLDLSKAGAPAATKMGDTNDIILSLGLCPVTERFILVADSAKCCIQCLDVTTGKSTVLLADPQTMTPAGEAAFFGVNRMCIVDGYIWYTNFSAGTIHRAPFAFNDGDLHTPLRITGPVEMVADDLDFCDGFQVRPDASAAYTLDSEGGTLMKTDLTKALEEGPRSKVMMERLVNPTCLEFRKDANGKEKLFVICCGEIEVGWINDSLSWKDLANGIAKTVEVTVTSA